MIKIAKKNDFTDSILTQLIEFARKDVDEILAQLGTNREGLTSEEAQDRLEMYGLNEVAHEKPAPWYIQLIKAFINPFIGILVFLAIVSYITDVLFTAPQDRDWSTIIIISIMVTVSGLLRFVQEYRSNVEAEKLKALVYTTAAVIRKDTGEKEIKIEEIVPGDIIHLAAGDMVPADVRVITSKDLFINQATLTGESEPVEKYPDLKEEKRKAKDLSLSDLENICFMGTNVVSGSAIAVVLSTGDRTYFGSMAKSLVGHRVMTSFERGINNVSKVLIKFMTVMFPIVFVINGLTKGNWLDALLFALAVAVGLTPEMLPMIVTTNLAKGAVTMAKRKTIVKRLDAIQNFGAMDVLCTDKTGTLTLNKIVVEKHLDIHGNEDDRVLRHAYLNSFYQTGLRNLMDVAILEYGAEKGFNGLEKIYKKVDEIPFDFVRRRMSVVLESEGGKRQLVTKGAVEEVLSICEYAEYKGEVVPLTDEIRQEVREMVKRLNEDGMRVLAVAQKNDVPPEGVFSVADESKMVLMGYIGFLDPPKESAPYAIKALKEHGVDVKILTGDNEIVTKKICKEVGINVENVLLGNEIENMTDEELAEVAEKTTIFAKLSPMQKSKIIKTLQNKGHIVGYMGDGINDAPALREADVGISVDSAVDIAKESADIILLEKSLTVLEEGVVEGRRIFGNIMKYIAVTSSSNFGNVFSVLVASAFLPFLPMQPLQLLFLNLTYDLSMTSVPWDTMDREYIQKPRKWDAANIGNFMIWFGPISSIFDITTYALMFYLIGPIVIGGSYFLLPEELKLLFVSLFQTGWFVESLWTQTMVVHMLRTEKIPFIQSIASWPLLLFTSAAVTVGTIVPFTSFGAKIGMMPLPAMYFLFLIATLLAYLILAQYVKTRFVKRFGSLL
ncbi:magnesium-translocating P-type ATPase [Thermoanaerobacter thermocopriae]|uniref:magnesium-translocating P-type ATPase n=1 Tax=Thermoanaerobacter thermocopriae TaxID=29350 RepID=UPI00048E01CB|nr:magnesium-translocating P-type ATPase [Thermoanaerobacter thermocopriae]